MADNAVPEFTGLASATAGCTELFDAKGVMKMPKYAMPRKIVRPVPGVAVDFDECFPDTRWGTQLCRCGKCAVCGEPKHSSLHGGLYGEPKGGQPYHHEFVAANSGINRSREAASG